MFEDDDINQEEVAVTSGHQVVSPYELRFVIDCVFDPAQQEKPKCRIKYVKPHSELDTDEIEEEDLDAVEDEMDEEPEKKRKHPKKTKGHKGAAADKDDENDDEDDYDDENQPILECISRAFSDD